MATELAFSKCYFCLKNFNTSELIDISQKSVKINETNVDYNLLILDTCCIELEESKCNFVCLDCNNSLVLFHMFKRDVKKYSNFDDYVERLKILAKLEKFLDYINVTMKDKNIIINEESSSWAIYIECESSVLSKDDEIIKYDFDSSFQEIIVEDEQVAADDENVETMWKCELKNSITSISENIDKNCDEHHQNSRKMRSDFRKEYGAQINKRNENDCFKKRKFKTLNNLNECQKELIRKQAFEIQKEKGRKKLFKCSKCAVCLSTHASLKRHLRDLHVLRDTIDEKTLLNEELCKSKLKISKSDGVEQIIWKCFQCNLDIFFKSEQAFKLHFKMKHLRTTKIDSSIISNCKTIINVNDMLKEAWKCYECNKIFRFRNGLRHHIKSQHPGEDNVPELLNSNFEEAKETLLRATENLDNKNMAKCDKFCIECGIKFLTAKIKYHRDCHKTFKIIAPFMPRYVCKKCRTIFNSISSLNLHLNVHDNLENVRLIPADGFILSGTLYWKEPTGDADDACLDEAVWKCGHCSVRYFDENDCVSHQLLLHSSSIHCFVDHREFSGPTGLSKFVQHMKNKHAEYFPELSYPCGTCKQEFSTIYEKLSHQKICSQKIYECDKCSKRYSSKHQLQSHILFEYGISGFSCEICGKRCKTMSDLKIHHHIHTGMRPYHCSICEKSFKTPAARSTHMEKHTLESGITCEVCGTKLSNRTLYQRHKRFQHNLQFRAKQLEKNKCNICNKSFLRSSHFKQHLKQQHGMN